MVLFGLQGMKEDTELTSFFINYVNVQLDKLVMSTDNFKSLSLKELVHLVQYIRLSLPELKTIPEDKEKW
jgi:hypothetical protein